MGSNWKRFLTELTEQEVIAKEILIHPSFNRRNLQNDICLIKTEKMILGKLLLITSDVSTVTSGGIGTHFRFILDPKMGRDIACLPDSNHPKEGKVCWAAGWGRDENGDVPKTLQEVDLEIISDKTCKTTKNAPFIVEVRVFLYDRPMIRISSQPKI